MLTSKDIKRLFEKLNEELMQLGTIGEVGIVGGAVMCLVYNARASTRDVDGVFEPSALIRELAARIASSEGLPADWLNDAAKGYIQPGFLKHEVLSLSNLRVWAPDPRYMLAMKCISARWDTHDRDDVKLLLRLLKMTNKEEVLNLIEEYYPKHIVPAKTSFFIEEVLGED
jgi:hypothetical protein